VYYYYIFKGIFMANGMQVFNYKAINSDGLVIHREVMVMDAGGAEAMLREKGYLIKTINNKRQIREMKKRVNRDDFIQFITEFIALIRAGLTVPEALGQCSNRPANPRLSNVLKASLNKYCAHGRGFQGVFHDRK
jgi:type II secretory pathway component PulF